VVGIEDGGVDVAFAADGGGVAEALGDRLDGLDDVFLELGLGVAGLEVAEGHGGEDGAGPGAEVFGGEVGVGRGEGVEVGVDVGGVDGAGVVVVVEVLEELVAGGVAAGFDDAGEAAVGEVDGVLDAGLAFELEGEAGAVDVDVAAAKGG
jgi:hypothetical protein